MVFYKYHGAGNDFLIADGRDESIDLTAQQIASVCDRHTGVGTFTGAVLAPADIDGFAGAFGSMASSFFTYSFFYLNTLHIRKTYLSIVLHSSHHMMKDFK